MTPKQLLSQINAHLKKTKESPSAFGKRVLNDPAFVLKLKRKPARKPFPHTVDKVLAAITPTQ